jgi:UDP:flavonoid glycosyltransferase YjiC (YdhE family)
MTNAERIVETGVGLRLLPSEFGPSAVRDAVRALVEDPRYRESVRSQRPAIEALPSPEEVVPILEAIA